VSYEPGNVYERIFFEEFLMPPSAAEREKLQAFADKKVDLEIITRHFKASGSESLDRHRAFAAISNEVRFPRRESRNVEVIFVDIYRAYLCRKKYEPGRPMILRAYHAIKKPGESYSGARERVKQSAANKEGVTWQDLELAGWKVDSWSAQDWEAERLLLEEK